MEEYTYKHTSWWKGFMKYTVEMGSVAVLYVPNFINISSGIRKLFMRDAPTRRQDGDLVS
jgi:hypothetical protein